MIIFI
jgi:hypothetical protein